MKLWKQYFLGNRKDRQTERNREGERERGGRKRDREKNRKITENSINGYLFLHAEHLSKRPFPSLHYLNYFSYRSVKPSAWFVSSGAKICLSVRPDKHISGPGLFSRLPWYFYWSWVEAESSGLGGVSPVREGATFRPATIQWVKTCHNLMSQEVPQDNDTRQWVKTCHDTMNYALPKYNES